MSHVVMVTWDGGGNVPPLLRIAAELRNRGHAVTVLGHEPQRAAIESIGVRFAPFRHARAWSRTAPVSDPMEHFKVFLDGGTGRDVADILADRPADAVVCDCLMLGALQAAQQAGVPTLVLIHSFWGFFGQALPKSPISELGTPLGRAPLDLWSAADEVLVLTDRGLDPASAPIPGNVRWTGVVQESVSPAPRRDPAHVLVSLSTVWFPGQQEAVQRILDALAELPVRVTATIDRSVDADSLRVPANTDARGYVPHAVVMPEVSCVIGHGGHATTMLALAHGLPLLIVPQFPIDQPLVGHAIAQAGAGLVVEQDAPVEHLRVAIERLLNDSAFARAAQAAGERLRGQDGATVAADRVDAVLQAALAPR